MTKFAFSTLAASLAFAMFAGCGNADQPSEPSKKVAAEKPEGGVKVGKFPDWYPTVFPLPELIRIDRANYDWTFDYALETGENSVTILFEAGGAPKDVFDFYKAKLTEAGFANVRGPFLHSAEDGENGYFDVNAEIPENKRETYNGFSYVAITIRPQTGSLDEDGMVPVESEFEVGFSLPAEY